MFFSFKFFIVANFLVCCVCVVKKCPKLKNRYKSRIEAAIEYAKTIDDFDDLVDPRTLAHHCLIPKPFAYVLCAINFEEKSKCPFFSPAKMTKKFNQEMYAKMRAKKNEPLSRLGKRVVRVVEKGTLATPATSIPEMMRMAFLATSVKEITLQTKKPRVADKG